jgi:SPP1 gp7 family putative phage head morphogenesis protein
MASAEEIFQDKQLAHGIYINRYSGGLSNRFLKELNDGIDDALGILIKKDPKQKRALSTTIKQIQGSIKKTYKKTKSAFITEMRQFIGFETDYQIRNGEGIAGVELKDISPEQITAIIKETPIGSYTNMSSWFNLANQQTYQRIASHIVNEWDAGKTVNQIAQEIKGTKALNYTDGVAQVSRNNAKTFVKTSVKEMETSAQTALWEENPSIVKAYEWVSVLDGRTSQICISRDGKVYPVDSGIKPPAHPNCRSSITPVFNNKAKQSESARYSISGKQPKGTTYREFLQRQPAHFQKDVLGKTKYEAFKKDPNVIDKFVSPSGQIYTIEQLKEKDVL